MKTPRLDLLHQLWELLTLELSNPIARQNFDMISWIARKEYKTLDVDAKIEPGCGTTACAVGWAISVLPDWQEVFRLDAFGGENAYPILKIPSNPHRPSYPFTSLSEGLDISQTQAEHVFAYNTYCTFSPGPLEVAARLKKLIETLTEQPT